MEDKRWILITPFQGERTWHYVDSKGVSLCRNYKVLSKYPRCLIEQVRESKYYVGCLPCVKRLKELGKLGGNDECRRI